MKTQTQQANSDPSKTTDEAKPAQTQDDKHKPATGGEPVKEPNPQAPGKQASSSSNSIFRKK